MRWENVDLQNGVIHIRATYLRKEGCFQNYPKGKKWHKVSVPNELLSLLKKQKLKSQSEYVASKEKGFISYHAFYNKLQRYLRELNLPKMGTHALRHSASEIYMEFGATRDDLRILFNHSSSSVTDRYVHDKGQRLKDVSSSLRIDAI